MFIVTFVINVVYRDTLLSCLCTYKYDICLAIIAEGMHISMYDHNYEYCTNALHNLKNDKTLQRLNLFKRRFVRTSLRWWPIVVLGC